MFCNKNLIKDVESDHRFYKTRDISQAPQSEWLFEIFKQSMAAKIKSLGLVLTIFVVFSIVYYEIVIQTVQKKRGVLEEISHIHHVLVKSDNETDIFVKL
jgi:hypothetical protein